MGWFDEQIEYRKQQESKMLSDSYEKLHLTVTGRKSGQYYAEGADVNDALEQLLKYFGIRDRKIPASLKEFEEKLDYLLTASDIMYRKVTLEQGWHKDAMGVMITNLKESGAVITVMRDAAAFILASLAITLVGMLLPKLNHILMGEVTVYGSYQLLGAVVSFMLFATIGNFMLAMIKTLVQYRLSVKLSVNVQAASMMRVLSLPADFFKSYSSGELTQYLTYMNSLCSTLVNSIFSTAITGVFSLVYLTQIFSYAKSLVIPSLVVTIVTLALSLAGNLQQASLNKEIMGINAQEKGLTYALIGGVEKIRLSGAEKRVYAKWMDLYTQGAAIKFNPWTLASLQGVFSTAITLLARSSCIS